MALPSHEDNEPKAKAAIATFEAESAVSRETAPECRQLPRSRRVWGVKILPYSHPRVQVALLGCILFLTVGMYQTVTNLGGAGQGGNYVSDVSNISLYAVFTVFCLIAPPCLNYFSFRSSLCFGGIGYAAYIASLWSYNHNRNVGFICFGGAWNGLSAAFLWPAITTACTSYATEETKGLYVTIYWSIFNLGVVIGDIIPLVLNWHAGTDNQSRVNDGTYVGFLILTLLGSVLGLALYPWEKIIREDGTRVSLGRHATIKSSIMASWHVWQQNKWIMWFWPFCWCNWYWLIYQNNRFNGVVFTVRARALNCLTNGVASILAAWILLPLLDRVPYKRRTRAIIGLAYIFVMWNGVCIGGYFAMRDTRLGLPEADRLDIYGHNYAWWNLLYTLYGGVDANYHVYAHWFLGALSSDPVELGVYNSMYLLLGSLTQAIGYTLDLVGVSKEVLFGTMWAYGASAALCCIPIITWYMQETGTAMYNGGASSTADTEAKTRVPSTPTAVSVNGEMEKER